MIDGFRGKLLWLHTWTGITIGSVMVLFAVTGAALAMRDRIDSELHSHLLSGTDCQNKLPLDALVQGALRVVPGSRPKSVEVRPEAGASTAVEFHNDDFVYFDSCTGRLLGIQNEYGGFSGTLDWIHRFHFIESGRMIGGVFNLAILLGLVVGGLILWWPRSGAAWKSRVTYNPRLPRAARLLSLHRAIGAYTVVLLLLLTVTAVPLSFEWAKNLIASATSSSVAGPKVPESKSAAGPLVSLDTVRQGSFEQMPTARALTINFPKSEGSSIRVEVLERGAPHINAKSYLYFDAVTGELLKRVRYATDIPLGRKVYLYFIALHAGLVGGLPYQLLLMGCCLAVPAEFYSGIAAYLGKRRRSAPAVLQLRIVSREEQTPTIAAFEFEEARGQSLPPFSAGAHIDVHLEGGLVRQYSLCNSPGETHRYVIAVQRAASSRGGSQLIHDTFERGQIVEASTPRNHFQLAHEAPESLLIAGGIGITPILCMAERLSSTNAPFVLHYCFRTRADAAFIDRMAASPFAANVVLHESAAGDRLNMEALLSTYNADAHIYVCGPESLNEAVIAAAQARGWPDAQVHREYFTAADIDRSDDKAFEVRIASSGQVIHIPADRSILEELADHGIDIPASCGEGTCGTCLTRVLQGEVEHRDVLLSDEERQRNDQFTPCCSRSRGGELVLDL